MRQNGQYLLAVDLGCYKLSRSQTLGSVPARRLPRVGGLLYPIGWIVISHWLERGTGSQGWVDCYIPLVGEGNKMLYPLERGTKHSLNIPDKSVKIYQ